jgi:16S rRNA pseudouridine516 synthase
MATSKRPVTLERLLQSQGFGSRKRCRILVRNGYVAVNGMLCDDPDELFVPEEGHRLTVDGVEGDWPVCEKAYILLNKPLGYECSRAPKHNPGVLSLLPGPLRERNVQPVGRLDVETTGLLLLTDDGQCIHVLTSPKHAVPKMYRATLAEPADAELCDRLLAGVLLKDENETLAAQACRLVGPTLLELSITQGKYHQVRRMVAAAGNHVAALTRVAIGDLQLPDALAPGEWQWLDAQGMLLAGWAPR